MNKKYNLFRISISFIILFVFLAGMCGITYFKAVDIKGDLIAEVQNDQEYINSSVVYYRRYPKDREAYNKELKNILEKYGYNSENQCDYASWGGRGISVTKDKGERDIYYLDSPELFAYEAYSQFFQNQDIGFYSMVKARDGKILAEFKNFMMILRDKNEDATTFSNLEYKKVLLFNDSFSDKTFIKMLEDRMIFDSDKIDKIEGTYDGDYLYPKKLILSKDVTGESKEYVSDKNNGIGKNNISDWVDGNNLSVLDTCTYGGRYGDYETGKKLYQEATSLCNTFYKELVTKSNTIDSRYSENLFTSYVGSTGYISDNLAAPYVFVFHPVALAIRDLAPVYTLIAIILIITLVIINSLIKKLKQQQISFENNRKELTRSVAHELKTPLGIIKSYTESLKDITEENKEVYTNVIINEVNHMDILIQDMLELSRLEAKARTLNLEEVELVSLTKSVLKRFDAVLKERDIYLNFESPEEAIISADLDGIKTVLLNLISNAIKHADSVITATIKSDEKSSKFSITNDGKHISENQIHKIWDTFFKEDKARKHQFGSTGLGLSITKTF